MRPRRRLGSSRCRIVAGLATAAAFVVPSAHPFAGAFEPTDVGFAVCPHVTQTTNTPAGVGPGPGCGSPVSSSDVFLGPDNRCTPASNTDLGTFMTTQNPLGLWAGAKTPDNCATVPPTRGHVVQGAGFTVTVSQTGACPTTLTVPARTPPVGGPLGGVLFPIGTLRFGTYRVTLDFPDQTVLDPRTGQSTSWTGNRATGTLHVGTTFTETDRSALAVADNTYAVLISSSVAGPGAGELVLTRTGNVAVLKGTDYYACGTISVTGTVRFGKRGRGGVTRLTGTGNLTGGTGNYKGVKGSFAVSGTYDPQTKRATFGLKGTATFASG